jgi:hypothetical protein
MFASDDPATVQLLPVVSRPARVEPGVAVDPDDDVHPVLLLSGLSLYCRRCLLNLFPSSLAVESTFILVYYF